MRITPVGAADLPELLPMVRAYCDFYQVNPSDRELLELSRARGDPAGLADGQRYPSRPSRLCPGRGDSR